MKKVTRIISTVLCIIIFISILKVMPFSVQALSSNFLSNSAGIIYFEYPADGSWGDYHNISVNRKTGKASVYCYIYKIYGDSNSLAESTWQSKKTACYSSDPNDKENRNYYFDISSLGTLDSNSDYGVVFSAYNNYAQYQTCDLLLDEDCFFDTVYVTSGTRPNSSDSNKKDFLAEWRNHKDKGPRAVITCTGTLLDGIYPVHEPKEHLLSECIAKYVPNSGFKDFFNDIQSNLSLCEQLGVTPEAVLEQFNNDYKEIIDDGYLEKKYNTNKINLPSQLSYIKYQTVINNKTVDNAIPSPDTVRLVLNLLPKTESINIGEEKNVTIDAWAERKYFTFTPRKSEKVTFYSAGDLAVEGSFVKGDFDSIESSLVVNDESDNGRFEITVEVEANKTYLLSCNLKSFGEKGKLRVFLKQSFEEDIFEYDDYDFHFASSSGTDVLAKGDEVTCAVSKMEGNLKGDSYSNGQSCPILRWVSSDENVIKITDSHAEYSRAKVKAVGYGTATLAFYVGSVKIYEATLNVISPSALKDNATVTILKQANKNATNILCDYNGWDLDKIYFVVADTSLTFFSDMGGTFVKQAKQAFGQIGDEIDLAQDDVIKEVMDNYFEYSDSKSDAVSEFKENWKYVKTGMKFAKTVYDDSKNETQAKKTIAKAVKKASNVNESDFDKVFKKFKTVKNVVGDSLKLYELSATAIMLEEFDKEIVWELMNFFDTSSSTYRALERLYDDMETDPVGYVIDNFVDEKITQLLEKMVDAAFSSVEMPKAVVETAFSILSIIYEKTGGVTVKAFDEATVAADLAEEALLALTSCTDSSKREILFNYCTSAVKVELNKCIAVCKSDSTTLKSKANDSLKKVNKLTYVKYIQNCVDEYNNPSDVMFENPDLERYKISAKYDIKSNYKSAEPVGTAIDDTQEDSDETQLVVPSSTEDYLVTAISENGFSNLSGVTTIYVPNSIQQIGAGAFYNCADTNEITLGNNVAVIGDEAFMNCASITDINLGANLQSIGQSAFENCSSLGEIKLAKDVTVLGDNAFAGCSALENIYIFNGNLSIPESTFDGCENLTIYGYSGSTAESYAVNHNIAFESIGDLISVFEIVGGDNLQLACGESLDTSTLSLNLTYSDGRKETVTEGFTVLYDNTTVGTQTAVVIYGNSYQTFEFEVTETETSQINFEEKEINVAIGDTINPAIRFKPDSIQRTEYELTSSDESVLCANGTGFVALKEGKAEIIANALDGSLSAKCVVEVSNIIATNCDDDLTDTIFFVAPETKEYTFYINNENVVIDVYDSNMGTLENRYDGEIIGGKTVFTVMLCADDVYVIQVSDSQNQDLIIGNPEDEPAFILADTDLDGTITISDVTAIQYYLAELTEFTDEQLAVADTNGDGEVNISDATHLQMFLADFEGFVLGKS